VEHLRRQELELERPLEGLAEGLLVEEDVKLPPAAGLARRHQDQVPQQEEEEEDPDNLHNLEDKLDKVDHLDNLHQEQPPDHPPDLRRKDKAAPHVKGGGLKCSLEPTPRRRSMV